MWNAAAPRKLGPVEGDDQIVRRLATGPCATEAEQSGPPRPQRSARLADVEEQPSSKGADHSIMTHMQSWRMILASCTEPL